MYQIDNDSIWLSIHIKIKKRKHSIGNEEYPVAKGQGKEPGIHEWA